MVFNYSSGLMFIPQNQNGFCLDAILSGQEESVCEMTDIFTCHSPKDSGRTAEK